MVADGSSAHSALCKDWTTADRLRKELADQGVTLHDSPGGPEWEVRPRGTV
jgi:cysteinyl-tRNA synthetase